VESVSEVQEVALVNSEVWSCGRGASNASQSCTVMDGASGDVFAQYALPWNEITEVVGNGDSNSVLISGRQNASSSLRGDDIARCQISRSLLNCEVKTFSGVLYGATSLIPHTRQIIMAGTKGGNPVVTVADSKLNTIQSYTYTAPGVESLTIDNLHSVPAFLGTFVAGSCVSTNSLEHKNLMFGWIRSYTGVLVATSLIPTSTNVVLSGESMTQAIAMDVTQLDMFVAGGLQLSDNAGTNAYTVRVNALYQSVLYGVRYRYSVGGSRRALLDSAGAVSSVVKGLALADTALYVLVQISSNGHRTSVAVLKTNAASGAILQQALVEGSAVNSSISCSNIVRAAFAFAIGCTVEYSATHVEATVVSISSDLSFSKLPVGFVRVSDARLRAESIGFTSNPLPVVASSIFLRAMQSELNSTRDSYTRIFPPTVMPTEAPVTIPSSWPTAWSSLFPSSSPSSAPSSQPSISLSAAPSVSPQPSSQPSTGGPTITNRPTRKPTITPSCRPTSAPTVRPSRRPTTTPTARPTRQPTLFSLAPSAQPTYAPSLEPTPLPSTLRPSSSRPSIALSQTPTEAPTVSSGGSGSEVTAYVIGCSVVGGLLLVCLGAWFYFAKSRQNKDAINQSLKTGARMPSFSTSSAGSVKMTTILPRTIANNRYNSPRVVPIVDMRMPYEAEEVRTRDDASVSSEARSVRSDEKTNSVEDSSVVDSSPSEFSDN